MKVVRIMGRRTVIRGNEMTFPVHQLWFSLQWTMIRKPSDLPKAGTLCLVTRLWPDGKKTIDLAFMGLWKNRRVWARLDNVRDETNPRLSGNEFQFQNVIAWAAMPNPAPGDHPRREVTIFREDMAKIPGNK